ncbi:fatty acid synthase-like [Pectinophora gossypiella]|uniref:fatty acid synthase-like n=1 Tax=Pectinophora gossypiella TaxID=13191 RepID=UPI00214E3FDF|nr:fatty acid synthase-like [Pectinophora gossypiella]
MAPTPQESIPPNPEVTTLDGETVVISGISGIYPQSHNVKELSEVLYGKVDPVASSKLRWTFNHPEVPPYVGTAPNQGRYDAQFFNTHFRLADNMDPMSRKIIEHTYQAIYDAGLNVEYFSGKNIGVYVGSSFSESDKAAFYDNSTIIGYGLLGNSKSMHANRVSYWLNGQGPSMTIDQACTSTLAALEQAFLAIRRGDCDAAVVGGADICLHPQTLLHYGRICMLSKDGQTRSFDENAHGLVRSEAIGVILLQKAKHALRIYAEVSHVKTEFNPLLTDNEASKNLFARDPEKFANFLRKFYNETKISPGQVEYVEAFGSAESRSDKAELEAIEKVFCNDRTIPLHVGSVMSNIGYCGAASGLCALTKVLLAYQKGVVAANLHCTNPRGDVAALNDGRMNIVTEHQPIQHSYTAVNGLSLTGINAHVLLQGHYKPKDVNRYKSNIPRLVTISGREETAVQVVIDNLKSRLIDPEELALLHNIHEKKIFGHMGRGFVILGENENQETISLAERVQYYDDVKRPLWYVYSGMGSQWAGMGAQLMSIPVFAAAIERLHKVLEPKGLDLIYIITSTDKKIFDNILHSFVGIAAIQIGLTDILREMGLVPDKIIGHSVGELGCGYADGGLTAEEMILCAYSRGLVSVETPLIRGSMAAVGVGYNEIIKLCPPEIDVACHNGPDSSTISGPEKEMQEFVTKLISQDIFAKKVNSSNIAFHSRYIAEAGPKLHEYLSKVIKDPKPRSERWLSTSIPVTKWTEENAKYCSPWYHTNNLLNPVLFEEIMQLVPEDAVTIEIAPHGLLQAILKRSLSSNCRHISLAKHGHHNNTLFMLEAIGKIYTEGFNPKVKILYPKVDFPVSTGTPMLSHLVKWVHTQQWKLSKYASAENRTTATWKPIISIHDNEYAYLKGNVVRGKTLYPFAATLVAVWDALAMASGIPRKQISVQFRDVHLYTQPCLLDMRQLRLNVDILRSTGRFEVMNEGSRVAAGFIYKMSKESRIQLKATETIEDNMDYVAEDIYKLLNERDYAYRDEFRSIHNANSSFTKAQVIWRDNWVTFIDSMLQLNVLCHGAVSQPSHIKNIVIDVETHAKTKLQAINGKNVMSAECFTTLNRTGCGGVLIEKVKFCDLPPLVENHKLLPSNVTDLQSNINDGNCDGKYFKVEEHKLLKSCVALQSAGLGDLNSLHWVETPELEEQGNSVTVRYAGINDNDVKKAAGIIPSKGNDNGFGMDFSGTNNSSEAVMGLVRSGAVCTQVSPDLLWPVPAHWTLEDAATVPLAYALAFYCFGIKSQLYPGMKVLIHGGTGALGQAAISIALYHQCEVFTTVSSIRKKQFLMKLFPDLNEDHIGNSRDKTFANMVLQLTNGEGCDIIISCVKGGLKNSTLTCASFCGITFDVTQVRTEDDYSYGMFYMTKQRSYMLVDMLMIFDSDEYKKMLQLMISEGIARGYVRPLSRVVYAAQAASQAFKLQLASQHRGRVLLRLCDSIIPAQPRFISPSLNHCPLVPAARMLSMSPATEDQMPLLQKLCSIADIKVSGELPESVTLMELGLNDSKLQMIASYLLSKHNISLTVEEIPHLTVRKIKNFEESTTEPVLKEKKGLDNFFSYIDSDELLATTDTVCLPTLVKEATLRPGEIDLKRKHLYMVPGIEGHHGRLRVMCDRLMLPATVLQPGLEYLHETIPETAHRYVKTLKKYGINDGFYLLGYETGILTVLEIASILEDEGLTGTIFCVGHTPKELSLFFDQTLSGLEEDEALQDAVIKHMCKMMTGDDMTNLYLNNAVDESPSWAEKVDLCIRSLTGRISYSTEYARLLIEAVYERIRQARKYVAQPRRLMSKIVFLRALSINERVNDLQQFSQHLITQVDLRGPLAQATADPRCAAIINNHLSADVLEAFESSNLCENYLVNFEIHMGNYSDEE